MNFCIFPDGPNVRAEARRKNKYGSFRVVDSLECARSELAELLPDWVDEVYMRHMPPRATLTSVVGGLSDASN